MTRFALVTVIHDSADDLRRLLASVDRCLDPAPEVVVVDSGSTDAGAEVARAHGAGVVDLGANLGFGAGSNAGLEQVTEAVTVLINPDVEPIDAGLSRLAGEAGRRDALLAPRLLNFDGSIQDSAHQLPGTLEAFIPAAVPRFLLPGPLRARYEPWRSARPRRVGWAVAACIVARTQILRRLGPFDPDAFLFYEDLDLCLRAADAGIPTELRPSGWRVCRAGPRRTRRRAARAAAARGDGRTGPQATRARRRRPGADLRHPCRRPGSAASRRRV